LINGLKKGKSAKGKKGGCKKRRGKGSHTREAVEGEG